MILDRRDIFYVIQLLDRVYNVNSHSGCDLGNKYFKYFNRGDIKRIIA